MTIKLLWDTVTADLPPLIAALKTIVNEEAAGTLLPAVGSGAGSQRATPPHREKE